MAKRYYWLKLPSDFFRQKAIKKLRRIAGGDTYTIIYMEMLLLAMQNDNKLYFEGVEDDFAEELALELDEDPENVKVTLLFLQKQGLIEIVEEDEYLLTQCGEMVGSETPDAGRKRRKRALERQEQKGLLEDKGGQCPDEVPKCPTEKEIEKEIEIDKRERINYQEIVDLYNNTCVSFPRVVSISENRKKAIRARLKTYCVEDLKKLFEIAEKSDFLKGKNDRNWTATFDWMLKDSNLAKILEGNYNNRTEKQQQKPNKNKFHNFEQRTYDYGALEQACFNKVNGIPTDAGIGGVR
ncbi:MAG: phage replisome organizer N-terminal domain-containing protein [Clostridiales bacterium]|nr:phage replisome organizer N-terminal domain-containing protein [Clostridiales bacterium]